jgi:hypothetical protein
MAPLKMLYYLLHSRNDYGVRTHLMQMGLQVCNVVEQVMTGGKLVLPRTHVCAVKCDRWTGHEGKRAPESHGSELM